MTDLIYLVITTYFSPVGAAILWERLMEKYEPLISSPGLSLAYIV
jgi:hypothetical protein